MAHQFAMLAFVAAVCFVFSQTSSTFVHPYIHQNTEGMPESYRSDVGYFEDATSTVKDDIDGASWSLAPSVAVGVVFGLVLAFGSAPALASNEASGYREKDQSIIAYNGLKAVGGKSKSKDNLDEYSSLSKSLGLLGNLDKKTSDFGVAPQAQITLEELATIDPASKPAKK